MIFMFIAIVFMLKTELEKNKISQIALTYQEYQESLNNALEEEFQHDLSLWGAELLDDNTIRFYEPEILFDLSSADIKEQFALILSDFFPRYIAILSSEQFKDNIDEIRIDGHTSSIWRADATLEESYLQNARLSQNRSLNVLRYVFTLESVQIYRDWMISYIRANGLSYAKTISNPDGTEDFERSQRVEFRVITKAEERIYTILESLGSE